MLGVAPRVTPFNHAEKVAPVPSESRSYYFARLATWTSMSVAKVLPQTGKAALAPKLI
jgi:hypothetical protein